MINGLYILFRELHSFAPAFGSMNFISATPNDHEDTAVHSEAESSAPAPQPTPARRPSEQERREFLESEKQIEMVEKHRVLCRACQSWIDLSQSSTYATNRWVKHKIICSDMYVTSRSYPILHSNVFYPIQAKQSRGIGETKAPPCQRFASQAL